MKCRKIVRITIYDAPNRRYVTSICRVGLFRVKVLYRYALVKLDVYIPGMYVGGRKSATPCSPSQPSQWVGVQFLFFMHYNYKNHQHGTHH